MKLSKMIEKLEQIKKEFGDGEVDSIDILKSTNKIAVNIFFNEKVEKEIKEVKIS